MGARGRMRRSGTSPSYIAQAKDIALSIQKHRNPIPVSAPVAVRAAAAIVQHFQEQTSTPSSHCNALLPETVRGLKAYDVDAEGP